MAPRVAGSGSFSWGWIFPRADRIGAQKPPGDCGPIAFRLSVCEERIPDAARRPEGKAFGGRSLSTNCGAYPRTTDRLRGVAASRDRAATARPGRQPAAAVAKELARRQHAGGHRRRAPTGPPDTIRRFFPPSIFQECNMDLQFQSSTSRVFVASESRPARP